VKLQRHGLHPGLVAGVVAGALALSACGSDSETPGGGGETSGNAAGVACADGQLSSAGSSAQKTAYTAWITDYQGMCGGAAINYDGEGSGFGRTQFIQKQVPLAGSDSALKEQQKTDADTRCAPGKAVDLPTLFTPVAIVYNLQGVDKLALTPTLIGSIFDNKITKWNDPQIAKANSGVTLPDKSITPIHRSSDSGTTDNLTKFLHAQDPKAWPYEPAPAWVAKGGQGASNSAAMVQQVNGADGAIGYVDNPDAVKNDLNAVAIDTGSGPVEINEDSVGKAIAAAEVTGTSSDVILKIKYDLKEAGAYPAILTTYQITCSQGLPADQAKLVKSFLTYQISDAGQKKLAEPGYVALPPELRSKVKSAIDSLSAG
jgi:phosphate transport system substrate-binding protein